jgi:replication initiation and membrane attachment protein DnaB
MKIDAQFVSFLKKDLNLSTHSIKIAWKHTEQIPSLLPIVLWQDGLITLAQLDLISDWMHEFQLPSEDYI